MPRESICALCLTLIGPDHENTTDHRTALARAVVDLTEFAGVCYWCEIFTPIAECRDPKHTEMLEECRALVAKGPGWPRDTR